MIIPFKGYHGKVTHWVAGCRVSIWSSKLFEPNLSNILLRCLLAHQSQRSPKCQAFRGYRLFVNQDGETQETRRGAEQGRARHSKAEQCYVEVENATLDTS